MNNCKFLQKFPKNNENIMLNFTLLQRTLGRQPPGSRQGFIRPKIFFLQNIKQNLNFITQYLNKIQVNFEGKMQIFMILKKSTMKISGYCKLLQGVRGRQSPNAKRGFSGSKIDFYYKIKQKMSFLVKNFNKISSILHE